MLVIGRYLIVYDFYGNFTVKFFLINLRKITYIFNSV